MTMKHLLALLAVSAILCGCQNSSGLTNRDDLTVPSESAFYQEEKGLYAPGSAIELATSGAVKAYPLPFPDACGIRMLGDDLLIFSGREQTTLTVLSGTDLTVSASLTLEGVLSSEDPSLRFGRDEFSFFLESTGETLVVTNGLKPITRIPAPEELMGIPILSSDRSTLYYCTDSALFAWDLKDDIHRPLKQLSYSHQTLQGLHMEDSVLQCRVQDGETLFLSTRDGKLLASHRGGIRLTTQQSRFYGCYPTGIAQGLIFGDGNGETAALIPEDIGAKCTFLPGCHGAVTVSTPAGGKVYLNHYDLATGLCLAALTLPESQYPLAVADGPEKQVALLTVDPEFGCETLYLWNPAAAPAVSQTVYTGRHYTPENPDLEQLEQCLRYAEELSEKYGIRVKIWKDAVAVQPWDYVFEAEHVPQVCMQELEALDRRLSQYPRQILSETASHFSSLSICLVRAITGVREHSGLEDATGIQFVSGTDAYVVLAAGEFSDRALYHELFHVMETHMWGNCSAFDRWEELNPSGFKYDYSYITNQTRDAGVYLQPTSRAFADTYSMSFPKEDRARIWENAMLPGNKTLFQSPTMQRKLAAVCKGIRDAYGLKDWESPLVWEQYLE